MIVTPGAFTKFTIAAPATTTTNATFTLSVSLTDADGNPYSGTVSLNDTTNSLSPTTIPLTSGTWTGIATITTSPNGGQDIITASYGAIKGYATITVFMNTQQGTITFGGTDTARIEFGTGSLGTANVTVSISTSTSQSALPESLPPSINFAGIIYNIELKDANNQLFGTQSLPGSVSVYLSYPDTENNGIVDNTYIREEDLLIYQWDNGKWASLTTHIIGTENIAWAYVPHFSTFTLGGTQTITFASNLLTIRVYPNPFKPYDGNADTGKAYDGSPNSGIIFDNLTQGCTIKIFNIVGELIFEKEGITGKYQWDAKNKAGKEVASGVYIYLITDKDSRKATGKIAIIR